MSDVFVSYKAEDRARLRPLVDLLAELLLLRQRVGQLIDVTN